MVRYWVLGLLSAWAIASAHAETPRFGEAELAGAVTAIGRRCSADTPKGVAASIHAMHESVGAAPAAQTGANVVEAYRALLQQYPQADPADLAETGINAMTEAVEPKGANGRIEKRTQAAGIGVEIQLLDGRPSIVRTFAASPAEAAGIRTGDRILSLNGADTTEWSLSRVIAALQGADKSLVAVTLARDGVSVPIALQIPRAPIVFKSVDWRLENDVAILTIRNFFFGVGESVEIATRELRKQASRGFILDLRGNPGGPLGEAMRAADVFLDGGRIFTSASVYECPPSEPRSYNARRGDMTKGAPILLLTDGETAGGAELVAAALVDRQRAATVGQKTFGDGVLKTAVPISAAAYIRLTTGKMLSPTGRPLSEGVAPAYPTPAAGAEDFALLRAMELLTGDAPPPGLEPRLK